LLGKDVLKYMPYMFGSNEKSATFALANEKMAG
jgi:hypothetical protein